MSVNRKQELLDRMIEYLENFNDVDFDKIGILDNIELGDRYDNCLRYIVELVGNNEARHLFEHILGFTKEELIADGMEWVYELE